MTFAKSVMVLAIAMFLAGCDFGGPPTLDTSSEEAYRKSLGEMAAELNEEEKKRLTKTLMLLAFDGESRSLLAMAALSADPAALVLKIGERANGLTAEELFTLGERIAAERQRKRVAELEAEIRSLEEYFQGQQNQKRVVKMQLGYVEVTSPRYYWREVWTGDEPVIEFQVKNASGQAIRKIRFKGVVTSAGRSVPWVDETFAFDFKGGLESLETQHLKLTPTLGIGDWNNADLKDRGELELAVEPIEVELATGGVVKYPDDFESSFKLSELENKRAELATLLNHDG